MLISYVIYKKCTLVGRGGGDGGRREGFSTCNRGFKSRGTVLHHPCGAGPDHSAQAGVPTANVINAAIKMFVLILTSESQLINKKRQWEIEKQTQCSCRTGWFTTAFNGIL